MAKDRGAEAPKAKARKLSVDEMLQHGEDEASALAADMPADIDGLLGIAKESVLECDRQVLAGDMPAAAAASKRYEAAIWKLNGGSFFGCNDSSDPNSATQLVEAHCRPRRGTSTRWGELGEFLISVRGIRCWVQINHAWSDLTERCFEFHALDLDSPFISETGFRSEYARAQPGRTVEETAVMLFEAFLSQRRHFLGRDAVQSLSSRPLPRWLAELPHEPRRLPGNPGDETPSVPAGFVFVDVLLPSHQAFIVRKWAKAARAKVAAARAAEKAALRGTYSMEKTFHVGQRCVIEWEPREVLAKEWLGKKIIIAAINHETSTVWAYDDKEVVFKKNRKGRRIVDRDPRDIQTVYAMEALRPLN